MSIIVRVYGLSKFMIQQISIAIFLHLFGKMLSNNMEILLNLEELMFGHSRI
jgi:hypothetical protein